MGHDVTPCLVRIAHNSSKAIRKRGNYGDNILGVTCLDAISRSSKTGSIGKINVTKHVEVFIHAGRCSILCCFEHLPLILVVATTYETN